MDDAYRATSGSFRGQVRRENFNKGADLCRSFTRRPGSRTIEVGAGGPAGGDVSTPNHMTFTANREDANGNRLEVSIRVVSEDGIFNRRPPRPSVADFTVRERNAGKPGKP